MKNQLPISENKKFKYSISFESWDEESLEMGETDNRGYEYQDEVANIGDILFKANTEYGIYYPSSFGNWESTEPLEDRDFFEKGIRKYFYLHIINEDGTEISNEENDFITFLLSDGRYNSDKFEQFAVGGIVLGSIIIGVGALISYFYFKDKNGNGTVDGRAKSVEHNGIKYPIKDAWRKEHNTENKNEKHEVPQENRKTFKSGGEIISSELNKGYQYTYEIDDNNNGSIYKEGSVYFVKGFENGNHFSESFEKFSDAKKYYLSKQKSNKSYAEGGKLGFSKEDYFLVVKNWVYFTFNYPHNFVKDAFNSEHYQEKFNSSYTRYGSVGVLMSFWANLDNENRTILSLWIKNNYFNGDKTKLMSISDDDYSAIINHWNKFCFNYPYDFIESVFDNQHYEYKFVRAYEVAGSIGAVNKFFTELSSNNQRLLTDWVYDNYKEMKYADGGSVFEKLMLEWKVFENGKFIESNTKIAKTLKEINDFIEENNLSVKDNDYTIKGFHKGKWETLISKYADGGEVGEVNSVSELYEDEFASNYPYARDMVAYFIFGDRDDNKIADAIKGKYSDERADESALSEIMLNYEYSWRYSMNEIEEETIDELGDLMDYYSDGGEAELNYSDILNVLKTKIDDSIDELPAKYESSYTFKGEEVEHESRDGFIPFTDGGYEAIWFEQIGSMYGSGYNLPTKPLDDEMNRQIDYNLKLAKESFIEKYPEIVEELGEENIDYNSLYESGYSDEAEELSEMESNNMWDDGTIMMQITAYYYSPNNDRGIDGKHTIRLFGDVNLESPYHRKGNLDDSYNIDFTFDSIAELEEKMDKGIEEIISWFDGGMYNESTAEMKIRRMAEGGEADEDEDEDEYEEYEYENENDDEYATGGKVDKKTKKTTKNKQPKMVRQYFEDRPYSYDKGGDTNWKSLGYTFKTKKEAVDFIQNMPKKEFDKLGELTLVFNGKEFILAEVKKAFKKTKKSGKVETIKDWYIKNYPTDELGEELNEITFEELWNEDYKKYNIYQVMGVSDSIVRERLFEHLAEIKGVDYDVVYRKLFSSDGFYAEGGSVDEDELEDWMHEALESLIEETGYDDLEITMVANSGNEFYASNGNEEYRVFKDEGSAFLVAEDEVRDDMEEYPENFNQDFVIKYIDGRDFFENAIREHCKSYAEDIKSESDSVYANRLIAEMVENGIMEEDDALSDEGEELAEERIDDFVELLTEEALNEGNDGFDYFVNSFGKDFALKLVIDNNLIDIYRASKDAVETDGIAHFLSSYDGETLYLSNDYVAYRTN
jgi:hypothetical protein